jgi:hypothetical protein
MDYDINYVTYELYNDDKLIFTGKCPSSMLHTITDMYCDFIDSPNKLKILYKDKIIECESPKDFYFKNSWPT